MRGPLLSHTRTLRWRRDEEPAGGSWPITCPAGTCGVRAPCFVHGQLEFQSQGERLCVVEGASDEVGHRHVTGADRHAGCHDGKCDEGGRKRANEQQEFACRPHSCLDGHR